jgi:hypothetical protein
LIKIIRSDSFGFDMPVSSLVPLWSRGVDKGWMTKRAAVLTDVVKSIRPEPGYQYIHLITMGAQEGYSCNRNGDGFNEKRAAFEIPYPVDGNHIYQMKGGLMERHSTFSKHAHVFEHHKNKDPKKAIGSVYGDAYNQEMKRGELIAKVPEDANWMPHLEKLANGEDIPWSMACKVPYDVCTICKNKAKSRAEYCKHAADHLTEITKEGHQVFVINDEPDFFDISRVFRPADRIAWSLRKVASAGALSIKSGAQLAEEAGLILPERLWDADSLYASAKLASAKKFAEIEKLVDGSARSVDNAQRLKGLVCGCPTENLPHEAMDVLQDAKLGQALKGLADAKICLSLEDFIKLVMGSDVPDSATGDIPAAMGVLPGMFSRLLRDGGIENCATDSAYDSSRETAIPRCIREALAPLVDDHSMSASPATRRIQITIIRAQPKSLRTPSKIASVTKSAEQLAREYAKYQLSYVVAAGRDDELVHGMTVLRNYV